MLYYVSINNNLAVYFKKSQQWNVRYLNLFSYFGRLKSLFIHSFRLSIGLSESRESSSLPIFFGDLPGFIILSNFWESADFYTCYMSIPLSLSLPRPSNHVLCITYFSYFGVHFIYPSVRSRPPFLVLSIWILAFWLKFGPHMSLLSRYMFCISVFQTQWT